MPDQLQPRWRNITSIQVISVLLGIGGGREEQMEGKRREWHTERD